MPACDNNSCFNLDVFSKQLVKQLRSSWVGQVYREERAVADKPEFVDMIRDATRQKWRRVMPRVVAPEVKEESRLSHWPPDRWRQWRLEMFTPWKLKSWKFKDWE
jgi:hypothetical protein